MKVDILDIFYKNIIPEAARGRIDCNVFYNMAFSTKILEENAEYKCNIDNDNVLIPILMIKDKELFNSLLVQYVNLAMNFYDMNSYDQDILNYMMKIKKYVWKKLFYHYYLQMLQWMILIILVSF